MEKILNELQRLESKLDTLNILAMKTYSELLVHASASTGTVKEKADSFAKRLKDGDPDAKSIARRLGIKLVMEEGSDDV